MKTKILFMILLIGIVAVGVSAEDTSKLDMNDCLDNPTYWWDQETDKCYPGWDDEATPCSDPDGGKNLFKKAHSYGFRSVFADKNDERIRTGGQDSCLDNNQIVEHYCDENGYIQTYYTKCANGCKDGVCLEESNVELIKEEVKCVFKGSSEEQKCYSADTESLISTCKGKETCTISVKGKKGEKITWKSSCGGYAYTKIDGESEHAVFDCSVEEEVIEEPVVEELINEEVKCVFKGSNKEQNCYSADREPLISTCYGKETCVTDVKGEKGDKVTWKSSCGGYAYTKIDGKSEHAVFDCTEEVIEEPNKQGFRYAYMQCYDGADSKQGGDTSCKSSDTWVKYAKEFCEGHCYNDKSKCGLNSFSVSQECEIGGFVEDRIVEVIPVDEEIITITPPIIEDTPTDESEVEPEEIYPSLVEEVPAYEEEKILICKNSCSLNGNCLPFGYRKSGDYCSDEGVFKPQLKGDQVCDNHFECGSNVCVSGKCVSPGLIERIINWLMRFI